MTKLRLTRVEPIDFAETRNVFGDVIAPRPIYPLTSMKRQHALRTLRTELAAQVLGITSAELLALEHGEYTCDWDEAERILRSHFK